MRLLPVRSPTSALVMWILAGVVGCGADPAPSSPGAAADTTALDGAAGDATGDVAADGQDGEDGGALDSAPFVADPATWGKNMQPVHESKPAGKGKLQAGVAMRYLHSPVGVSMAGYGGRSGGRVTAWSDVLKASAGLYGFPTIKVVALEVGGERMALVKSPLMSSESYLTDSIARHLQQDHGLDFRGRVITMAGHSHHTHARYWPLPPSLGTVGADTFDAEVAEWSGALMADAIAEAWAARAPAEWAHGQQDDWDPDNKVYRDRRDENNPTYGKDPRLSLLAFRRAEDKAPLATIVHFAIHGTVFGGDNDIITEDAPGYVEHKFEELFFARTGKPLYAMFAQSSGGDASPAGDALGHPELARLEKLGEDGAPAIFALYQAMSWQADAELAIRSQRLELVFDRLYANTDLAAEFGNGEGSPYRWGAWQCKAPSGSGKSMQGKPKLCMDVGSLLSLLGEAPPHEAAHQGYHTVARLGDVWLMTMPGEPTWSIVKYAREQAAKRTWNGKPATLMVIGYSQDHYLYLSAPDDWYLGGYEAEMSLWGPASGRFFADAGLALLDAMAAGSNGPALHEESPSLFPPPPWQPRPRERSLSAGTVSEQPAAAVARTDTARFAVHCGDPALGAPWLRVQRADAAAGGKGFVDLPAAHGWAKAVYDNSRYEIVTIYDPDPPPTSKTPLAERTHTWRFYWQVPPQLPTGTYRFSLRCLALGASDSQPQTHDVTSESFAVGPAAAATLTATPTTDAEAPGLRLSLRVPGIPQQLHASKAPRKGAWATAGYRLLDRDRKHQALALVRADLQAELLDGAGQVLATVPAPFDAAADVARCVVDGAVLAKAKVVRAWIPGDATPAKVEAAIAAP